MSLRTGIAGLLLACAVVLTACDGGGDPVQQAVREASAAHQASALKDGAVTTTIRPTTPNGDRALVAKMIERHRASMAAADAALAQSSDPAVLRMARSIKDRQAREIAELQAWTSATD